MRKYCYKGKLDFLEDNHVDVIAQKLRHFYLGSPLGLVSCGVSVDDDVTTVSRKSRIKKRGGRFKSQSLDPDAFSRNKTIMVGTKKNICSINL